MGDIKTTDSYGSARWANPEDLADEGILHFSQSEYQNQPPSNLHRSARAQYVKNSAIARSFLLGRLGDPAVLTRGIREGYEQVTQGMFEGLKSLFVGGSRKSNGPAEGKYIGWAGDGHILTVAPTRSGKGVGLVIPNLLHYPGSVLVIDPKGENYAVTHKFREKVLGQKIVCLDPFHIVLDKNEESDSINPFDGIVDYSQPKSTYIQQNPELLDEANMIADSLIMRSPEEKDPHWNDKCRTLLKGLILAVICGYGRPIDSYNPAKGQRRHLSEVRYLLTLGVKDFSTLLVDMEFDKKAAGGLLSRASLEIQSMGKEEQKNVISFALKHTEFLDTPLVEQCLGEEDLRYRGSYNLRDLKTQGGVSIYMILPPHYLTRYVRLFRLWITMAMAAMTRTAQKPADGCPVLFMLDEMAQLGTMEMMRQAVSLLAGYGMSVWMIWQDLSQLKALYEHDWPSFIANAKIQQFFGINDHETAKYISEMLGTATIGIQTSSEGSGRGSQDWKLLSGNHSTNQSVSYSEKERNLLSPDEVRRLNREAMLMFVQGIPPILAERISYFKDSLFNSKYEKNPYI
ncbi:MAG: hypothetical protein E7048_07450 [Lentisphaerae bacterium]|nr:hypothetical protein [Lentisphaerota bacterium]